MIEQHRTEPNSGRKRIGIYCPGNGTGGPWRYVHSILAGIDLAEFDVVVFSNLDQYEPRRAVKMALIRATDLPAALGAGGPEIDHSRPTRCRSLLKKCIPACVKLWGGFSRQARALGRLFRAHQLDLLHTNNTGCEESPVAARLARVPRVVGTLHVDSTYDLHRERSGARHRLLEMVSNRCLDCAIAVSQATKADWVRRTRLSPARVTTIHNGIDAGKFKRRLDRRAARALLGLPDDGRLIIGGVGRLEKAKGFSYLIEAVAQLASQFPQIMLVLAGDGPLRPALAAQAARLGMSRHVRFLGFQHDVQPVLDALDVFAIPSRCETLGYALLEAMATELPVVGARVGGIPEVIVEDATGFIVPPRSPRALANSLQVLLASDELRTRFGRAGRERVVRHFQEKEMIRQTIDLYRQLTFAP